MIIDGVNYKIQVLLVTKKSFNTWKKYPERFSFINFSCYDKKNSKAYGYILGSDALKNKNHGKLLKKLIHKIKMLYKKSQKE